MEERPDRSIVAQAELLGSPETHLESVLPLNYAPKDFALSRHPPINSDTSDTETATEEISSWRRV